MKIKTISLLFLIYLFCLSCKKEPISLGTYELKLCNLEASFEEKEDEIFNFEITYSSGDSIGIIRTELVGILNPSYLLCNDNDVTGTLYFGAYGGSMLIKLEGKQSTRFGKDKIKGTFDGTHAISGSPGNPQPYTSKVSGDFLLKLSK